MPPSSSIRYRRASQSDARLLAQLRYEFRARHAPSIEAEDDFLRRCVAWMTPRLAPAEPPDAEAGPESAWRAWVAEEGDRPVGGAWMQIVEKIPNPGQERECHAYLSSFYVRPGHRNAGIGSGLLQAVLEECARLGVDSIVLWPSERSRPLYARYEFRPAEGRILVRQEQ